MSEIEKVIPEIKMYNGSFNRLVNRGKYALVAMFDKQGDQIVAYADRDEDYDGVKNKALLCMRRERAIALSRMSSFGTPPRMEDWSREDIDFWDGMVRSVYYVIYMWDDRDAIYKELWCPDTTEEFASGWMSYEDYMYYLNNPAELTRDDE